MKDSFYFQHDYNARNDERILQIRAEHGLAGYALYFMLLESMAESSDGYLSLDGMAGLSLSYGSAIEQLKALVSRCIELKLFHEVKGRFSSKRMVEYKEFRKERSESGRRGATNRWDNSSAMAQPLAKSKTANAKDSIGKDRKEKKNTMSETDFEAFWNAYPNKKGKVDAQRHFLKLPASDLPKILNGLASYKKTPQWNKDDGQFIPHGSTFVNKRLWEDEAAPPKKSSNSRYPIVDQAFLESLPHYTK